MLYPSLANFNSTFNVLFIEASLTNHYQSSVLIIFNHGTSADPEGGTGGPDPPGKSQVIWFSIGNYRK